MVRTNCRSAFALLALSISCRGERDQRPLSSQSAATDVADSAVPARPLARRPSMAPDTGPTFVVHGACPFECCRYGHWRLESTVVLPAAPQRDADSAGVLAAGPGVRADSGVVVMHPVGLALVISPPTASGEGDSLPFAVGNTVGTLNYEGEGYAKVRLHGRELSVNIDGWDTLGTKGVRIIRRPVQAWWVHMTDSTTKQRGWVLMDGVRVEGSDACG